MVPLETNVGATATYPVLDAVGSVTGTTSSSGALTSFSYTAYGTPVGASSGSYAYGTYGYDGDTGLYYGRARYYDPGTGRFLSEDPVGYVVNPAGEAIAGLSSRVTCSSCSGTSPAPIEGGPGSGAESAGRVVSVTSDRAATAGSSYAYCRLDPISLADPAGRFAVDEFGERLENNQAANAQARYIGQKVARELGCTFTKVMREALHRAISKQGFSPEEIEEIARELFANCE